MYVLLEQLCCQISEGIYSRANSVGIAEFFSNIENLHKNHSAIFCKVQDNKQQLKPVVAPDSSDQIQKDCLAVVAVVGRCHE